jgi:hypothetical protein
MLKRSSSFLMLLKQGTFYGYLLIVKQQGGEDSFTLLQSYRPGKPNGR